MPAHFRFLFVAAALLLASGMKCLAAPTYTARIIASIGYNDPSAVDVSGIEYRRFGQPVRNTLGVAPYRDGNFKEAFSALQKYRELRTINAEWSNPFLLAMARWQLGDKDEPREWFDKGAQWMEAHNANSETMVRFRNEAAESLGLVEKKE